MMRLSNIICLLFLAPCALLAQPDRITAPIDARRTIVLKGNVHPSAQSRFDLGPVEPAFRVGYITLMLKKTDAQQAALEQLLEQQQNPASPSYHNWLTPEQYADRFGLSQSDLDKISAWLRSEGFTVEYTARGRNWLTFSGTAGQVLATFHTQVHRYRVDGEMHFAAAAEPSVPASLEPLVAGLLGLDDFYPKPPRHPAPANTSSTGAHTLVPDDIATIYDITKLYQATINGANIDGTGQSVVVVGQTAIDPTDVQGFRSKYNLPALNLTMTLNPNSSDPGTNSKDVPEADLDLEWASAVAQKANFIYVYGTSADGAVTYAIDNNLAPVITESYGNCETQVTSSSSSYYRSEAQKAATEGITWLASTGDSGAADCDEGVNIASHGLAVNFPASIPEVTAVGGTEFSEAGKAYWNAANGPNGGSAISYIPEMAWNDTSVNVAAGAGLAATGGGASSIYAKPAWQTGNNVPSDNVRDVPDISLDGANDHDPYNVMTGGSMVLEGGTSVSTPVFAGIVALLNQYVVANKAQSKPGLGNINPTLYHLAASAPSAFHDITTGDNIVPCEQGTPDCPAAGQFGYSAGPGYDLATGLGSVDVYNLVTQWSGTPAIASTTTVTANPTSILTTGSTTLTATVSAGTGSATPSGSVFFTLGSGGAVLATANLSGSGAVATAAVRVFGTQLALGNNSITASYGGVTGFGASSGSATVSVSVPATSTTTTVTANPTSITAGGSTALTATVKASSGSTAPTGSVAFALGSKSLGVINLSGSGGTATALLTVNASQLTAGNNTITASYGASNGFSASSGSVTVTLSVSTGPSHVVPSVTPNPVFQQAPDADGYTFFYTLRLSEIAGNATTLTGFTIAGTDHSSDIPSWFGSGSIPANGTIAASVRSQIGTLPVNRVYTFSGTDASGSQWTQQITVPFLAQPSAASMVLSSSPATVVPDTNNCSSQYPYYQQLNLQEQNGYEVQLTRFLWGGNDDSSTIGKWFGSWRLAPFGSLEAAICWSVSPPPPTTFYYEVDGTDTAGNKVTANLYVPFQSAAPNAGALTVSKSSVSMSASPSQSAATTANVNAPSGQAWTVGAFPASERSGWLVVSPLSGTGPATVTLVAAAPGLANGVYTTTLVFQSANTTPQFVNVPVTFTIGASSAISIAAVAHGASYQHLYAPGMLVSVFGTNLAAAEQLASTLPLPLTMGGVSATVNGIAAPLLYVSPSQLNIQIPYETTTGTALLAVSNNGLVATNSFSVSPSAPGLFTQNQQGTGPITATSSGGRGQQFALYVTGAGEVSPPIANGAVPTGTQVPVPLLPVSVTVGGVAATLDYVGLPSWSVGTLQVNFTVPPNAPLGPQPVVVTVGTASSPVAVTFTVQ
jgi:uncharacterized protein (TIGR03437 family)